MRLWPSVDRTELLAGLLARSGASRVLRWTGTWQGLLVLNYHRIGVPGDSPLDHDLWSADEEQFSQQISTLKQDCDLIRLDDLDDVLNGRRRGRHALITFDDGYRDNYELAYPVLQQHGISAVVFLATGFLDRPRLPWWDEVAWMVRHARTPHIEANGWIVHPLTWDATHVDSAVRRLLQIYKTLPGRETHDFLEFLAQVTGSGRAPTALGSQLWMTWDMVREMHAGGVEFGAHTVDHPVLRNLTADEQHAEIQAGCDRLQQELQVPVSAFSYPVGKPGCYDEVTRACLRDCGIRWAFNFSGGLARPGRTDADDIPRVAVERNLDPAQFRSLLGLPQLFA